MTDLLSRATSLSLLALAALPIVALGAARAQPATLRVSELTASRSADAALLKSRTDQAAVRFCRDHAELRDLSRQAACKAGVRAEVMDKLSAAR